VKLDELTAELTRRIEAGNGRACADLLLGLGEKTRRTLARVAAERLWDARRPAPGVPEEQRARRLDAAKLAALGTFTEPELREFVSAYVPSTSDLAGTACDIVAKRWAEGSLARARIATAIYEAAGHWEVACLLESRGIAPSPGPESRLLSFIWGATAGGASPADVLRARPDLRAYVWLFFGSPGAAEALLSHDAGRADRKYVDGLRVLANEGLLERAKLLDGALAGLAMEGAGAPWFRTLHDGLAPDVNEQRVRVHAYLGLLARKGATAIDAGHAAVARVLEAGAVAPERMASGIEEALVRSTKGEARRLVRLLSGVAGRSSDAGGIALLAAGTLRRDGADDQAMALDVIERHARPGEPGMAERLREYLPYVAPSNRTRLLALLGVDSSAVVSRDPTEEEPLRARAARIAPAWRSLAGVDSALEALDAGKVPHAPLALDPLGIPRLHKPVRPITGLHELIDEGLAAIEGGKTPDDLERILDGIARLCRLRPDDFEARAAPLRFRCVQRLEEAEKGGTIYPPLRAFVGQRSLLDLTALILAWLEGSGDRPSNWNGPRHISRWLPTVDREEARKQAAAMASAGIASVTFFHSARLVCLAMRAHEGKAARLLSTPTHEGGFIDPLVLVERLKARAVETDRMDAIVALLRLAPEHRRGALEAAGPLVGELGAALRHALGGVETVGPDVALWYAAARARSPLEDDPAVDARHPDGGPDAARAARYTIDATLLPNLERGGFSAMVHGYKRALAVVPPCPDVVFPDRFPTVWHLQRSAGLPDRWETSLWPLGAPAVLAREASHLAVHIESQGAFWKGDWEALFDADAPLGVSGTFLIALGIAARHPSHAKVAEDALVAAIEDGRLDPVLLGTAMGAILRWGAITMTRWIRALREVASVSALHLHCLQAAVASALGQGSPHPSAARPLVELLVEWVAESGEPIGDLGCRSWLSGVEGKGRAANTARRLLAPAQREPTQHRRAAALRVLASRVERAERWAACIERRRADGHAEAQRSCHPGNA
jgi:hypothetical protein